MRQSVDRLLDETRLDRNVLKGDLRPRDVERVSERLEATYVIRIFAEFEGGLRQFWLTTRETRPPTEVLVDRVAALQGVPLELLAKVQKVRDYRNDLIHEREERADPIPLADVRRNLSTFLGRLPNAW